MTRNHEREAFVLAAVASGARGSEIAAQLGVSRERVRQIYTRATGEGLPDHGNLCTICGLRYPVAGNPNARTSEHRVSAEHRAEMERRADRRQVSRLALFWARVDLHGPIPDYAPSLAQCWIWTGQTNANGYGQFTGRVVGQNNNEWAHRVAYTLTRGPIPEGLTLDHLCRVPRCVNPAHLEPVTQRENVLRSPIAVAAINARKTHCKYGHPLSGDNVVRSAEHPTHRRCRACHIREARQQTARKTAARRELRAAA